jgi:hypothetical protein
MPIWLKNKARSVLACLILMTFFSGVLELNKIAVDKTNMFTKQLVLNNEAIIFSHYRYVKDLYSKYNYY